MVEKYCSTKQFDNKVKEKVLFKNNFVDILGNTFSNLEVFLMIMYISSIMFLITKKKRRITELNYKKKTKRK